MDRAIALDRHLGVAGVHDRLAFLVRLSAPDSFVNRLVAPTVAGSGLAVVLARLAAFGRAASVTADSAEEPRFGL